MSLIDKSLRSFKKIIYSPFLIALLIICLLFIYKYLYMNTIHSALRKVKRKYSNCNVKSEDDVLVKEKFTDDSNDSSFWQCSKPTVSVYSIQGHRQYMEDKYDLIDPSAVNVKLYGVFDGHGGSFASSFAEQTLFKRIQIRLAEANLSQISPNVDKIISEEILSMDEQLLKIQMAKMDMSGSTVLVAAIYKHTLSIANVGDSRAVLCSKTGRAVTMSFDHKPDNALERKRIEQNGGFIAFAGVWRVGGILATSRAIGDYPLKVEHMLIAEPEITHYDLSKGCRFIILATDGLWDVFSDTDAVDFIKEYLDKRSKNKNSQTTDVRDDHGTKELTIEAFRRGSMDNITVMVIMVDE